MKYDKHDLELGDILDNSPNIHKKSKSKHKKDDEIKKQDVIIKNYDNIDKSINEPKKNPELKELYSKEIIDKFNELWIDSKINIIIEMIEYLSKESTPNDYTACIETFMIPIDKEVIKIIN